MGKQITTKNELIRVAEKKIQEMKDTILGMVVRIKRHEISEEYEMCEIKTKELDEYINSCGARYGEQIQTKLNNLKNNIRGYLDHEHNK